jgi:kinesin family protein 6/9
MYDLLSQVPSIEQTGNIMIQDDALGGIHIKGLGFTPCRNEEEALNCLFEGESNKTIAEHALNK